jgi:hypothetical protein
MRVALRALAPGDVPLLVAYRNDPVVLRFQSWSSYSVADASALVALLLESRPGVDGAWHQWGIEFEGALVGDIGLRTFDGAQNAHARPAHRVAGRDQAVTLVLRAAFDSLGFHRVIANTDPSNALGRVLTRLGLGASARSSVRIRGSGWMTGTSLLAGVAGAGASQDSRNTPGQFGMSQLALRGISLAARGRFVDL